MALPILNSNDLGELDPYKNLKVEIVDQANLIRCDYTYDYKQDVKTKVFRTNPFPGPVCANWYNSVPRNNPNTVNVIGKQFFWKAGEEQQAPQYHQLGTQGAFIYKQQLLALKTIIEQEISRFDATPETNNNNRTHPEIIIDD